ncbi:MAG: hypothetical protein Q4P18_07775 [Methanobrevibacter sp.]|uniref:hypothetical protein n=1 Tax=Methanobrevibacter sp. TaxID=66852 RepID=UPI0026DF79F8|nr:hypothetical protein [Methanobrevibacter sp.]MDO5849418.1 hypothetical protein [Methanobrevibacter sp.]
MKKEFIDECNRYFRNYSYNGHRIIEDLTNEIQYLFDKSYIVDVIMDNGQILFGINKDLTLVDVGVIKSFVPCEYFKEINGFLIDPIKVKSKMGEAES